MAKRKAKGTSRKSTGRTPAAVVRRRKTAKKTARPSAAKAAKTAKRPRTQALSARAGKTKGAAATKKAAPRSKTRQAAAARTRSTASRTRTSKPAASRVPVAAKKSAPKSRPTQRALPDDSHIPTPPSSLDMKRHGSSVRTGRAELAESRSDHATMTPSITGGDVDADVENAYFTGDEAPGGDNPTPDQDIVDEIGRALGIEYQDNEELRGADKLVDRDKHRWELDPASSEDYRERR